MDGLDLYVQKRIQTMEELWQRLYVAPMDFVPSAQDIPLTGAQTSASPAFPGKSFNGADTAQMLSDNLRQFKQVCANIFQKIKEW